MTPEKLVAQNLEQAFLTAITFHEAPIISQWYGPGYDLPTSEEWQCALHSFAAIAAHPSFVKRILDLSALHPRAGELVEACERAPCLRTQALSSADDEPGHSGVCVSGCRSHALPGLWIILPGLEIARRYHHGPAAPRAGRMASNVGNATTAALVRTSERCPNIHQARNC